MWKKKTRRRASFAIGNAVRILPRDKIEATLDSDHKLDGCLFMDNMWDYCGHETIIIKIVKNIWNNDIMLKIKTPIYLLNGLRCNGNMFIHRCDRHCYFLWHENWLEKL